MTTKKIITEKKLVGEWHTGPSAPNGCVKGQKERILTYITIFEADYYSKGPKLYVSGYNRIESENGCIGYAYNSFQDGNPEAVKKWMEAVK